MKHSSDSDFSHTRVPSLSPLCPPQRRQSPPDKSERHHREPSTRLRLFRSLHQTPAAARVRFIKPGGWGQRSRGQRGRRHPLDRLVLMKRRRCLSVKLPLLPSQATRFSQKERAAILNLRGWWCSGGGVVVAGWRVGAKGEKL